MIIRLEHNSKTYKADLSSPIRIGIPVKNGEDNPNCFWAEPVEISTIVVGDFVGSVAQGGSTNYQRLSLTPHGNGTHTECYGHITTNENATIDRCLQDFHAVAQLISIDVHQLDSGDEVIRYEDFLKVVEDNNADAIIIRTLPNDPSKLKRQYSGTNPPYLESEIAQWLVNHGVKHLLLDLPSVDRELDEGKLSAHNIFWQTQGDVRENCTITELIYADESISDGLYLLNLQIPQIVIDAVPSNPTIYPLEEC